MRKPMPVGISDFNELISNDYYFVDKSLFIKTFLDNKAKIMLFARPRRFGKTITMSMIKHYFSLENREENQKLFSGLAIAKAGEKYRQEQGKYPVIFLSLKDVKFDLWKDSYAFLCDLIKQEYLRFNYLLKSDCLEEEEKKYFESIVKGTGGIAQYAASLAKLTMYLHRHHGTKPILLIDEYDVAIEAGYINGFYKETIEFMRVWLSGGLKDNVNLHFAIMTGILRVAKESIFSGLNNLEINTILSKRYSDGFGFTQDEVNVIAENYGMENCLEEIKAWYDGYLFGTKEIYNPWSVINYFKNDCQAIPYWLHTSSNNVICYLLDQADNQMKSDLKKLLQGKSIQYFIQENLVYGEIHKSKENLITLLLFTGYLKVVGKDDLEDDLYDLAIPNQEIYKVYRSEIINKLQDDLGEDTIRYLLRDVISGNAVELEKKLQKILLTMVSFYDTKESFYQGLLLGLMAVLSSAYEVTSNKESGYGRFDLALIPKKKEYPGILMEFKVAKKKEQLESKAKQALKQIKDKKYRTMLETRGIDKIYCYGIAFSGKNIKIEQE